MNKDHIENGKWEAKKVKRSKADKEMDPQNVAESKRKEWERQQKAKGDIE